MAEEQYYFEGLTPASVPPSEPPHNGKPANWDSYKGREILFLALLPEPLIVPAIKTLTNSVRQRYGFIRKPIAAERLHISLLGLGDYSDQRTQAFSQIAALVRFPPIEITLDKAVTFLQRDCHPFVLTSEEGAGQVGDFHKMLRQIFCGPTFKSRINPHMTLIWDPKVVPEYKLDTPIMWLAREFVLVRSYQGKSRYDIVGRWPLLGDG